MYFSAHLALPHVPRSFFTSRHYGLVSWGSAAIGYAVEVLYSHCILPEIAESEDQDKVSAKGFLQWVISEFPVTIFYTYDDTISGLKGISSGMATPLSFLLVAWWFGFAQYTFHYLPNNVYNRKPEGKICRNGYRN